LAESDKIDNSLFERYLHLLNIKKDAQTFELLKKTVSAHLIKIPFENISKLIFKKEGLHDIPDLETFLNGAEKYSFGGTCYTNNYYLYLLLEHLGYDIILCGADMNQEDVHIVSIVKINGREYLVDVGYAAPFYKPLARNLKSDYIIESGNERYVLKPPDKKNYSKMEHHIDGELKHGYNAKPLPRKIQDFKKIIEDSYADHSTFMNAIRITKFTENGSVSLRNLTLSETISGNTSNTKVSFNNLPEVIQNKFGMPTDKARAALTIVKELKDMFD